jgi:ribosome-associated protein
MRWRRRCERPVRRGGYRHGRWVLLDFLDVVVHVQHSEERVFYALDRLWKDCPTIPWVDAAAPAQDGAESAAVRAIGDSGGLRIGENEPGVVDDDRLAGGRLAE